MKQILGRDLRVMMLEDKLQILRGSQLFSHAPEGLLEGIAAGMETVLLQPEQSLFKKGDFGDAMYSSNPGGCGFTTAV